MLSLFKRTTRYGFTLFLLVLNTVYLTAALQIRVQFDEGLVGPKFLPFLASGIMYFALLHILWRDSQQQEETDAGLSIRAPVVVVLVTVAYVALFQPLGYALSTCLFAISLFWTFDFERKRPLFMALYAVGVTFVFYLLFGVAFHVRLPLLPGAI